MLEPVEPQMENDQTCQSTELLEMVDLPPMNVPGVVLGKLVGFNRQGAPLVRYGVMDLDQELPARATVPLSGTHIGAEVSLHFVAGDPGKPIISGILQPLGTQAEATLDGQRLEFRADREIVLRCGDASITLTRAGKILLRGCYISSRSSGANKVKGATVHIN